MKLSEKGKRKILDNRYWFMNEFEPNDFQGAVILSIEEAKRLHDCAMFFWDDYEGTKLFTYDDEQFLTEMKKRIEQAEMSIVSTQCENVSKKDEKIIMTVEEANLLFKVIDGFFDLRLPTTKEIVALNKLKVRVERIAKAEQGHEV